jgi:4-amino-4-deoxy-L-arabinose transferase-like glycosyltransferase
LDRHRLPLALALAAAAVLLAFHAWTGSILGSDDAIYASVARDALREGRLLDFAWQGRPFLDKGPVLFWLLMASQAVFGDGEWALRLPGILAGLALLAAVYRIGHLAGLSSAASLVAAAFGLATSVLYFNARRPMTDVPGAALALWGLALALEGSRRSAAAGGVLLGLSALTKLTAPLPALLALAALQVPRATRRPANTGIAVAVAVAAALPWHLLMVARHGDAFVDTYLGYHLVARAATSLVGTGGGAVYLDWLAGRDPFATVVLGACLVPAALAWRRGSATLLAASLLAGTAAPLAASATALPHYLVALVPGACLAVGVATDAGLRRLSGRAPRASAAVVVAVFAAAFAFANGRDLADPDYASGSREACASLASDDSLDRLAGTFDLHDAAVPWYCDRQVTFFAIDPGFLAATRDIPMLRGFVEPLSAGRLADLASTRAILVTRTDRLDGLAALAADAGVRLDVRTYRTRVVVELGR